MSLLQERTNARVQALTMTIGLLTFVSVGLAACLALVVGLFWLVANLVLLLLQAIVEVCSSLGQIWAGADSFVKVLILALVVYGGYRLYCRRRACVVVRGGKHAED